MNIFKNSLVIITLIVIMFVVNVHAMDEQEEKEASALVNFEEDDEFMAEHVEMHHVLIQAIQAGDAGGVANALQKGAFVNGIRDGAVPLVEAVYQGTVEIVRILLAQRADPNAKNTAGESPLMVAIYNDNRTTFMESVWGNHIKIIKMLLVANADVNETDAEGNTALLKAMKHNSIFGEREQVVKMLLARNAAVNAPGRCACTTLLTAVSQGYFDVVKMLLDRDADVNARGLNGATALCVAISQNNNNDIVHLLFNKKANINAMLDNGVTPLSIAVKKGNKSTVKLLLKAGAKINTVDDSGCTPLSEAIGREFDGIAIELSQRGAILGAIDRFENEGSRIEKGIARMHKVMVQQEVEQDWLLDELIIRELSFLGVQEVEHLVFEYAQCYSDDPIKNECIKQQVKKNRDSRVSLKNQFLRRCKELSKRMVAYFDERWSECNSGAEDDDGGDNNEDSNRGKVNGGVVLPAPMPAPALVPISGQIICCAEYPRCYC